MANPREVALKILYKIEKDGAYSNLAVKEELSKSDLDERDKALTSALVYGVVQRRLTLQYIISSLSGIKLKKISEFILIILELGIYQIMYMDKIPHSAAVNESVKLAKRYGHIKSAGYVNGMLRNVVRNKERILNIDDEAKRLSVENSFPQWIADKWVKDFGYEFTKELMEKMNTPAPMTLRVNTLKATRDEVLLKIDNAKEAEYIPEAVLCRGFDIQKSKEYKDGYVTVQDQGAMLVSRVLDPKAGERVIDVCAAPGGKTTHLAQLMDNKGEIIAFDIHPHKIDLIKENARRLGIDIIDAKTGDASVYNENLKEYADKVLADVPCSGLGIIRRKPDIKWNREESDNFCDIQYKILENSAKYLKKGGELLYSTCTLSKEENEGVIEKFLENNKDFMRVDINPLLPEKFKKSTGENGYITLYPNVDDTDGFFIAKLEKV